MNSDEAPTIFIIGAVVGAILGAMMGFAVSSSQVQSMQSKAVELHAAEWVVDAKTGKTTFTWRETK